MNQKNVALTTKRMIDARTILVRDNPFFGRFHWDCSWRVPPVAQLVQMVSDSFSILLLQSS